MTNKPMGISNWINHGKKYGYYEFLTEKFKQEILKHSAHIEKGVLVMNQICKFCNNPVEKYRNRYSIRRGAVCNKCKKTVYSKYVKTGNRRGRGSPKYQLHYRKDRL